MDWASDEVGCDSSCLEVTPSLGELFALGLKSKVLSDCLSGGIEHEDARLPSLLGRLRLRQLSKRVVEDVRDGLGVEATS